MIYDYFYFTTVSIELNTSTGGQLLGQVQFIPVHAWRYNDLYIWHWFGGRPGSNIDVTLVNYSPLLNDLLTGRFSFHFSTGFSLQGVTGTRSLHYLLVDGIYPNWRFLRSPSLCPTGHKRRSIRRYKKGFEKISSNVFGCYKRGFSVYISRINDST